MTMISSTSNEPIIINDKSAADALADIYYNVTIATALTNVLLSSYLDRVPQEGEESLFAYQHGKINALASAIHDYSKAAFETCERFDF